LTGAIALRFIVPLRAPYANRHGKPMALGVVEKWIFGIFCG